MRPSSIAKDGARRLPALGTALLLSLGLFAPAAQAAAPAAAPAGQPATSAGQTAAPRTIPVPKSPDTPKDARPLVSDPQAKATAPTAGSTVGAARSARALTAAACDVSAFTGKSGAALVQQVKGAGLDCVNTLFTLTGNDAKGAFNEAQMVTVANALRDTAATYPGDNSTSAGQLVLFLRAGYYVQWYNKDVVGPYGTGLQTAIRGALDAFYAAPHSKDATDANGATLAEAVTLIDSAQENARYTGVVKRLLNDYTGSWPATMTTAVANTETVIERGFDLPEFVSALQADPTFATTVSSFVTRNSGQLNGGDTVTKIGIQLGNLVANDALRAQGRPIVKDLINRYPLVGNTGPLTMNLLWFTEKKDAGNCSYYGTCDVPAKLVPLVLTVDHTCNANLRIRAQDMTAQQLADTCTSLVNQDAFFHKVVKDNGPVPNDNNTNLEVVVFDDYYNYSLYAWEMYKIDVDNGGMYEEGNPATVGNQARFIAHEASWLRPQFQIWNLNHEYTHYLDGRYDMYGDFEAGMTTPTIWWVEGLAEYVSYSYRGAHYDDAVAQAGKGTYALSTLFDTTYDNADSTRIYNWGYLAVRYMLQSHPQDVDALLAKYRAGDWNGARTLLKTTIGTAYDADFATWLKACAADNCGSLPTTEQPKAPLCTATDARQYDKNCRRDNVAATTGNYSYSFLNLPAGVKQLTITTSGGTGNADLYYNAGSWATTGSSTAKSATGGNGETLTITNPPAGYVFFSLYAQQGFGGVTVTTTYN
ncbi:MULTISPECIES: M9 family metallopeptidase [Streptomycetaceae]|uniref:M9 family metallopeptidase n=1 Tax=Streptomycetaceae TaxID=2062 RepID=UPI000A521690|nr:M9 family metallopeptidase [Streptomyces sp. CB02056]